MTKHAKVDPSTTKEGYRTPPWVVEGDTLYILIGDREDRGDNRKRAVDFDISDCTCMTCILSIGRWLGMEPPPGMYILCGRSSGGWRPKGFRCRSGSWGIPDNIRRAFGDCHRLKPPAVEPTQSVVEPSPPVPKLRVVTRPKWRDKIPDKYRNNPTSKRIRALEYD